MSENRKVIRYSNKDFDIVGERLVSEEVITKSSV